MACTTDRENIKRNIRKTCQKESNDRDTRDFEMISRNLGIFEMILIEKCHGGQVELRN